MMTRRLRKTVLSVHLITSIGWIGADLCLLALGVTGVVTDDVMLAGSAYRAAGVMASWVVIPAAVGSLLTGVLLAVGSKWGLVRYWWVATSLVITTVMVMLAFFSLTPGLEDAASKVADAGTRGDALTGSERQQLMLVPVYALVLLLSVTVINVFKPWGRMRAK